jgi:hypothetical protein
MFTSCLVLACVFFIVFLLCAYWFAKKPSVGVFISAFFSIVISILFLSVDFQARVDIKDSTFKEEIVIEFDKLFYHYEDYHGQKFSYINLRGRLDSFRVKNPEFYFNLAVDKPEFARLKISQSDKVMEAEFHLHSPSSICGGK